MIYTTYTNLLTPDLDAPILAALEAITGNHIAYGVDTPISIETLLDQGSLYLALYCLSYATVDTIDFMINVGSVWLDTNLNAWLTYTNGLPAVFDLVYYCDQYNLGRTVMQPNRYDYCGRLLGGSATFTIDLISQASTILTEYIAPFPTTKDSGFFDTAILYNPSQFNGTTYEGYTLRGGPVTDFATSPLPSAPIFVPSYTIPDMISGHNNLGITYLSLTEQFEAETVKEGNGQQYARIGVQKSATLPAFEAIAASQIAQAAITLAGMVITRESALSAIGDLIIGAYTSYSQSQVTEASRTRGYLRTVALGSIPPLGAPGDDLMSDAAANARYYMLQNEDYLRSFDRDSDNKLSDSEFRTMLSDLHSQIVVIREETATNYLRSFITAASYWDTYVSAVLVPSMSETLKLYLSATV